MTVMHASYHRSGIKNFIYILAFTHAQCLIYYTRVVIKSMYICINTYEGDRVPTCEYSLKGSK